MWRKLARVCLWALFVLVALVGLAVAFLTLGRNRTPAIVDERGHRRAGSIALLERRPIGGVDQWLLIRGEDVAKPVLLFLHGGPGMPAMYLAHSFQAPLERSFVVVQWDRRGAGKSYDAHLTDEQLTVDHLVADVAEVTRYLRERFKRDRIVLLGHSWASYLGLRAVAEHPEWYSAYVGTGQLAGDADSVAAARRSLVMARAHEQHLDALELRLARGGAPTEDDLFTTGGELNGARSFLPLIATGLFAPEYTLFDSLNVARGAQRWMGRVSQERPLEWLAAHKHFAVPIFFFVGRHDSNTPSALAAAYLDTIDAPQKRLVWFEQSAHFSFFEEPEKFARQLAAAVASEGAPP